MAASRFPLSIAMLASVAFLLLAVAAPSADAQIYYDGAVIRFYHVPSASYCYLNTAATNNPLTCVAKPNLADATVFMLTGVNVPWKTYVESPTTPAILNGGALSKWCRPNNFTGGAPDDVYCSGPGSFTWMQMLWIQLIKVGGLGSNYIYNNDRVIIHSSLNNANCTLLNNKLNCGSPGAAGTEFNVVI
ncbi:hypothetical protein psal_cds_78 [Pandoravirus salinus]|uniref:Uncharacterized protein n=1 Tax=Pandoravirus salinus TaxID=1349410 RepID=A0A291ATJ7_9VIRU|nr:hypothetical protein psal_cds_78 [Pandoravirus salinus]ATE82116.1 hypothetical protein psal_cds_78 [Pandoravirus salinus]